MTARRIAFATLGAVVVVAALVVSSIGGDSPYRVRLELDNALGLRSGSDVTIGGIRAGTVKLHLGRDDRVVADLDLDRSVGAVGRNASAAITAVNFLGQKRVELDKGNTAVAAPSGFVIPQSRVTTSTDLDQVLNVLDAGTRARLTILINEAGGALKGRRADVSQLVQQLPHSMERATTLLNQLAGDNHTLAHLVTSSDRFVAQIAGRRKSLTRMVDVLGTTAATVAARRTALRQTLAQAPGTLVTLQHFLGDLRATTIPLGPAARDIKATAPALSATLAQVDPFTRAADPALAQATRVAPELTRLAAGATPVLRRATPTAGALARLSTALPPVTDTLNHSIDNVLAVVENWSRAIQFRDGLSHVFRGEAVVTPETLRSIINRLTRLTQPAGAHSKSKLPALRPTPPPAAAAPRRDAPAVHLPSVGGTLQKLGDGVTKTLKGLTGKLPGPAPSSTPPATGDVRKVLDFLLGS
jgi:phospholipid/cholesterol/gamma-HCH transport system substrate-binding protein